MPSLGRSLLGALIFAPFLAMGSAQAAPTVVFLNFDGAQLKAPPPGKGDHAARGESELVKRLKKQSLVIAPTTFPTDTPKDLAIQVLLADIKSHFKGLDIRWVTERPIDDLYSMVVIGGSSDILGIEDRELGWGPTDCGNRNPRNVAFVFPETITAQTGQWNSTQVAATISQEMAHALGLEHVDGPGDLLMRPVPALVGRYRFSESCRPIVPGPVVGPKDSLGCGASAGCPEGQQNDLAVLESLVGKAESPTPGGTGGATSSPGGTATSTTAAAGGAATSKSACKLSPKKNTGLNALLFLGALAGLGRRRARATMSLR